jgi:hypothetical protein
MLTGDLACPPLRDTEAPWKHQHRLAPARRARQFPFEISRSPRFSQLLVGDQALQLGILALELLQALDIVGLYLAELRSPTVIGRLGDFEGLGDLRALNPSAEGLSHQADRP